MSDQFNKAAQIGIGLASLGLSAWNGDFTGPVSYEGQGNNWLPNRYEELAQERAEEGLRLSYQPITYSYTYEPDSE